jgi:hypothetical protein
MVHLKKIMVPQFPPSHPGWHLPTKSLVRYNNGKTKHHTAQKAASLFFYRWGPEKG